MAAHLLQRSDALASIADERRRLLQHPIYTALRTPEYLRLFMAHHVFAVWDFMSLLKRLQNELTCVTLPWRPSDQPRFARFIQEIALAEECDEDGRGGYASHFELYLEAMREVGADTAAIERVVQLVGRGCAPAEALGVAGVPAGVESFTLHTLSVAMDGGAHEAAAAFFFGREELIPDMFRQVVRGLEVQGQRPQRLMYYLHRHIELDEGEHRPLAQQLLEHLCGDDAQRWEQAAATASQSLRRRAELWDAVVAAIDRQRI